MKCFENIELDKKMGVALVSVNPKIYPLGAVFAAAYVLLEKAFVVIDGDPQSLVVVSIMPKKGKNPMPLALEFSEQLVNFALNFDQSARTKAVREQFIRQAFITHSRK